MVSHFLLLDLRLCSSSTEVRLGMSTEKLLQKVISCDLQKKKLQFFANSNGSKKERHRRKINCEFIAGISKFICTFYPQNCIILINYKKGFENIERPSCEGVSLKSPSSHTLQGSVTQPACFFRFEIVEILR